MPSIRRYGPALFLTLLIPALSLLPAAFFRAVPRTVRFAGADKAVHAAMYAAFAFALLHALAPPARARPLNALAVFIAASLYGLALEIAQGVLTTSRAMDPLDALANAAGALLAALLAHLLAKSKTQPPPAAP
jgi:VanZ family protein